MSMLSRFATLGGGGDPYWNNVSYLLVGNGANNTTTNIVDSSKNNLTTTVNGSVVISTAQSQYGGSSVSFPGSSGSYLNLPSAGTLCTFGTGDFTFEFWVRFNNVSSQQLVYDSRPTGSNGAYPGVYLATDGTLIYYANSINAITSGSLSANTWYYVAVARSSTSTKLYVSGNQVGSTYSDSTNYLNGSSRPMFGASGYFTGTTDNFNGYIYDLRITKGVARYTGSTMTVPTAPLPTY